MSSIMPVAHCRVKQPSATVIDVVGHAFHGIRDHRCSGGERFEHGIVRRRIRHRQQQRVRFLIQPDELGFPMPVCRRAFRYREGRPILPGQYHANCTGRFAGAAFIHDPAQRFENHANTTPHGEQSHFPPPWKIDTGREPFRVNAVRNINHPFRTEPTPEIRKLATRHHHGGIDYARSTDTWWKKLKRSFAR